MKKLIMALLFGLLVGCATSRVNVDYDSCVKRGNIDGINIADCEKVKVVK